MGKKVHAFCPVCGDHVDCREEIEGSYKRVFCTRCRYQISEKKISRQPVAEPAAPRPSLGRVISADDTAMTRQQLADALSTMAKDVKSCENGFDFLVAWQQAVDHGAKIDLVILDVDMPVLDGINAAIAMRAVEKEAGLRPTPILFFTGNTLDPTFQRALNYLAPARHVAKSSAPGNNLADVLARAIGEVQASLS